MDAILSAWLPPAAIIAVIIWTNNVTNKRIDDLRNQMLRERNAFAGKVDRLYGLLDNHVNNRELHKA